MIPKIDTCGGRVQQSNDTPAAQASLEAWGKNTVAPAQMPMALDILTSPLRNDGRYEVWSGGTVGGARTETFGAAKYQSFALPLAGGKLDWNGVRDALVASPATLRRMGIDASELTGQDMMVDSTRSPASRFFDHAYALQGNAQAHTTRVLDVMQRSADEVAAFGDVNMGVFGHKFLVGRKGDQIFGLYVREYGT